MLSLAKSRSHRWVQIKCYPAGHSDLASFKKRKGTLICISLNHDDDDNTKATSKKSADQLLWLRNLVSESNYFRAIAIVRILLKITWKILRGNLKILGFLSQIFIKTMYRITKNDRALEENNRAHRKTTGHCALSFGLARTLGHLENCWPTSKYWFWFMLYGKTLTTPSGNSSFVSLESQCLSWLRLRKHQYSLETKTNVSLMSRK